MTQQQATIAQKKKVISFGCRLNYAEAEQIEEILKKAKLKKETIVINSCSVTNEAERQLRQKIRQIHRKTPETQIILTGCAAQTNEQFYKNMAGVTKVIGNDKKLLQKSYTNKNITTITTSGQAYSGQAYSGQAYSGQAYSGQAYSSQACSSQACSSQVCKDATTKLLAPNIKRGSNTRFILPVQQGCDHRCTFCIIPYARGKSRSLSIDETCQSVKQAVDNGVLEVVLSGIDIASWGGDLEGQPKLGCLIEAVLRKVKNLARLRVSSIDGAALDDKFKELLASEDRLMPHIHLSLQAGDDLILKRMLRRHSRSQAIQLCNELSEKRKDIALGADLIAGFPTESEQMFQNTCDMIEEAGLNLLHIFPFSPMRLTPAARMPQLERSIVRLRANRLRLLADKARAKFLQKQHATYDHFLIESVEENGNPNGNPSGNPNGNQSGNDGSAIAKSKHNIRTRVMPAPMPAAMPARSKKNLLKKGQLVYAHVLPSEMQRDSRSLLAQYVDSN